MLSSPPLLWWWKHNPSHTVTKSDGAPISFKKRQVEAHCQIPCEYQECHSSCATKSDLNRHYQNQHGFGKETCPKGCGYLQSTTRCEITWRDAKLIQVRLSLNLGQDELISEGNGLNDSLINNDDTYTNSDYSIGGLLREPWSLGTVKYSWPCDYGHGNLEVLEQAMNHV